MDKNKLISKIEQLASLNEEETILVNLKSGSRNLMFRVKKQAKPIIDLICVDLDSENARVIIDNSKNVWCYEGHYIGKEYPLNIINIYDTVVRSELQAPQRLYEELYSLIMSL